MKTCATCKHWGRNDHRLQSRAREGTGTHECHAIQPQWEVESKVLAQAKAENRDITAHDVWLAVVSAELEKQLAVTQDGSDYDAVLITHPNFGCVKHEPLDL
jgi:hypothetical protein